MSHPWGKEKPPRNVIAVVGPSGSGKTELICNLVAWLTARGLAVGVLKHSHHRRPAVEPEAEAFREARVRVWARPALGALQMVSFREGEPEPGPLVSWLASRVEILVVEGYKSGPLPKILLAGPGVEEVLPDRQGVVALIAPSGAGGDLPVFPPGEIEALGRFLLDRLGLRSRGSGTAPAPPVPADGPDRPG